MKAKNKKRSNYTGIEKKKFLFVYLMLLFPVVQFIIFWGYVNISAFVLAFQNSAGEFSFDSFKEVFEAFGGAEKVIGGVSILQMLGNSLIIWGVNFVCFWISLVTTYILTRHMIGHKVFRVIFMLPGIIGSVVFCIIMQYVYMYNGPIIGFLEKLGIELPPKISSLLTEQSTAFVTLIIQSIIFGIAGGNVVVAGAYMRIPKEIFEAAELDGVGLFREVFQIAIPCVWSSISTLLLFQFCSIFTADYNFYLYSNGTGGYGLVSIGYYLYRLQVYVSEHANTVSYGYVSAFGLIISAMTIPIVIVSRKVMDKINSGVEY